MAKREKSHAIEVQNGPISMDAQYTQSFHRSFDQMIQDVKHNTMRQEKMTMDLHKPAV